MKLGILVSHPIQYHSYWFQHLAAEGPCEIEVLYMHRQNGKGQAAAGFGVEFEWDVPLLEGYPYRFLDNVARVPSVSTFAGCDTPGIYDVVEQEPFDALLVFGWNRKAALQGIHACRRAGVPVLMRGDSQLETPTSPLWALARYPAYRAALPRIDAHLYVGRRNRAYLARYGVPDDRLFYAPHFVNNAFFGRAADAARRDGLDRAVRAEHGIPDDAFVALFVGKFIEKKRAADLVRAVGRTEGTHALLVGDGPLAPDIRAQADPRRVHFAGFRNQTELPAYYAAADALVLPSDGRETWGLVANEAMACGLPILVSRAAGCSPDLVVEGRTGFHHSLGNVAAIAKGLHDLAAMKGDPATAQAIAAKIAAHTVKHATDGLERALSATVPTRRSAPRLAARRGETIAA